MTKRSYSSAWMMRIKQHYKARGMRTADVAELLGWDETTLRSYLNGHRKIKLEDFFRLCDAVQADPNRMLFGELTPDQIDLLQRIVSSAKDIISPGRKPN